MTTENNRRPSGGEIVAALDRLRAKFKKVDPREDLLGSIDAVILGEKIAVLEWVLGLRGKPTTFGAAKNGK